MELEAWLLGMKDIFFRFDKTLTDEKVVTENQVVNALEWCKKYNIDINFGSVYLQNYDKYKKYFDDTKYEKWKQNKYNYI